ncbi:Ti-type conjugative transfer relaxase TraA [Sphingomonas sp. Leaf37]|uniref:Ti-type conjugative transfer relaxase TraA n=1 Tax=Sphingomonas sp. Leaf37 TaxID=2876552 RepID=UPI001E2CD6D3|nr:Ti-type conjugative transfer relaxase TraA [Sphingomonas sp. Leaf37]
MAIYHFSAKVISRAAGSSALASAAYRSASRLHDQRLDRHHDFSNKAGIIHSEVMLPEGAPERFGDREALWNAVEAVEVRKDAQLAREIEFAIPRELSPEDGIALARDFVAREFVDRGMIADLNVHCDIGADGEPKPHAHVMLTMREVKEDGFGPKVRDWNATSQLEHWREAWANHVNQRLAELDIDARVDHRTLAAQGIDLEPQHKIGPAASRMAEQGLSSERLDEHHAIARSNGEKLLANPALALDAITHGQATFTTRDLAMFVHRHSDGKEQFDAVMAAVRASPELVALGNDGRGEPRFTSRSMIETEQRLDQATTRLDAGRGHDVGQRYRDIALARAAARGMILSPEQRGAFEHVTDARDLGTVIGYAGTGKSAMLGVAREAWEGAGYQVQGLALSGIAAENLESGSGIASRTIASLEHHWGQGRELLNANHLLVIDEAGMIGTRQMERVLSEAQRRGAKVVLVGDAEQLQAIEAGAAFRATAERHGSVEITDIRRQREDWQRQATRALARERTGEAIAAYADTGHVHAAATRGDAREALVDRWDRDRQASPQATRIILTHTRDEVAALNDLARRRLRDAGEFGEDVSIATTRGQRDFADGDRVMFLKNERSLGVKNGSLGTVTFAGATRMSVMLDDGRNVAFDLKDYADIDHGYAATIHKAQGMTVDRTHVLATSGLDRHATYVALSRHRDHVDLHYGQDDFADQGRLVRTLARERGKDMASDYTRALAPERAPSITPRAPDIPASTRPPAPKRDLFAGIKLDVAPAIASPAASPLDRAVERFARAAADVSKMRRAGLDVLPHQNIAHREARQALDAIRPEGARDLVSAFTRDRSVLDEAVAGRPAAAIRAMQLEAELRAGLDRKADRFIDDWQAGIRRYRMLRQTADSDAAWQTGERLSTMAKSLERDPQVESLLRNRSKELGITVAQGQSLSQSLQRSLDLSRSRGIGL